MYIKFLYLHWFIFYFKIGCYFLDKCQISVTDYSNLDRFYFWFASNFFKFLVNLLLIYHIYIFCRQVKVFVIVFYSFFALPFSFLKYFSSIDTLFIFEPLKKKMHASEISWRKLNKLNKYQNKENRHFYNMGNRAMDRRAWVRGPI